MKRSGWRWKPSAQKIALAGFSIAFSLNASENCCQAAARGLTHPAYRGILFLSPSEKGGFFVLVQASPRKPPLGGPLPRRSGPRCGQFDAWPLRRGDQHRAGEPDCIPLGIHFGRKDVQHDGFPVGAQDLTGPAYRAILFLSPSAKGGFFVLIPRNSA